jgi:hypothetical protein
LHRNLILEESITWYLYAVIRISKLEIHGLLEYP